MHSLDDALAIIKSVVPSVQDTESCVLSSALGKVLAQDVTAPNALPPFTNTGVDGYAFRHAENQVSFRLIGASFAGEPFAGIINKGEAARIATGAVLPEGADSVVMQEVCIVENGILRIKELPAKGANLRPAGGDIQQGEIALSKGHVLRPQDIAFLSALGIQKIDVFRKLKIAIISTGLELLPHGEAPKPGQIIDTNTLMLTQMLEKNSLQISALNSLSDDLEETRNALIRAAEENDVVITTGGVSVGDRDFVRDVLQNEGKVHFWKMAIRPGKPVMVGHIGKCVMVALPGNPVSAYITSLLIVRAVLNALWGRGTQLPEGYKVALGKDITKPEALRTFSRALYKDGKAWPYKEQGSNLYTSITHADGILDLPIGCATFSKDEEVLFRPFSAFL